MSTDRRTRCFSITGTVPDAQAPDGAWALRDGRLTLHYAWPAQNCVQALDEALAERSDVVLSGAARLKLAWISLFEQNEQEHLCAAPRGWRRHVISIHSRYFEDSGARGRT